MTLISCKTNNQRSVINQIDKNLISQIELLIADTSIIDLPAKQLTKLIDMGEGQSFVDSSGNSLYPPSQKITFKNADKDSLVAIFNDYLNTPRQQTEPATCIISYTHVFLLYGLTNKISEQIEFAFNCPMRLDYLHRGIIINPENNGPLLNRLVNRLKSADAFIPVYGPPPPVN